MEEKLPSVSLTPFDTFEVSGSENTPLIHENSAPPKPKNQTWLVQILGIVLTLAIVFLIVGIFSTAGKTVVAGEDKTQEVEIRTTGKPRPVEKILKPKLPNRPVRKSTEKISKTIKPVVSLNPLTKFSTNKISDGDKKLNITTDFAKQNAVREAIKFAFNGYASKCFGQDDIYPETGKCDNWLGQGNTIVDSMDTLWIAGLKDEFNKGRDWIANELKFDQNKAVSFFETSIRVLGGLLSTYELSGKDKVFLEKAEDLGSRLLGAFNTNSGFPRSMINLGTRTGQNGWKGNSAIIAEIGTVQLEFAVLSKYTGNKEFEKKAHNVFETLDKMKKPLDGLYPIYLDVDNKEPKFQGKHITLNGMGDSLYEYFLKLYILNGDKLSLKMYQESASGIKKELYIPPNEQKQPQAGFANLAEHIGSQNRRMEHLACFAGGMFGLAVHLKVVEGNDAKEYLSMAEAITHTCVQMYKQFSTKLAPEYVTFGKDGEMMIGSDRRNLLRPETIESLLILYRVTGKEIYRQEGWEIFQTIDKHCKGKFGYSSIKDISSDKPVKDGKMESFFIAETLKYLYLLFSDDTVIPLDKYVFNTEAHPFEIFH